MSEIGAVPRAGDGRRGLRHALKALSVVFSAALLVILYRSLDVRGVGVALRAAAPWWLALAVGLILPITLLRALRFKWIMPSGGVASVAEAVRITLVASALNVFLPAKTGDFAKSLIVTRRGGASGGASAAIVVYERLSDTACMIFWGILGVLVARPNLPLLPSATWSVFAGLGIVCSVLILSVRAATLLTVLPTRLLGPRRAPWLSSLVAAWPALLVSLQGRRIALALFSVFLWLVQLLQVWLFAVALSADISFAVCASVSSIALIVGQIPGTLSGIGARDMTLVLLLSAYIAPEKAAALGILTATRTLVPALLALPTLRYYLGVMVEGETRDTAG
ncbi:MAG: lysylphosphatidylglycerol synthase transmembrane domain-containing protein [Gemmatimonas sp.]